MALCDDDRRVLSVALGRPATDGDCAAVLVIAEAMLGSDVGFVVTIGSDSCLSFVGNVDRAQRVLDAIAHGEHKSPEVVERIDRLLHVRRVASGEH